MHIALRREMRTTLATESNPTHLPSATGVAAASKAQPAGVGSVAGLAVVFMLFGCGGPSSRATSSAGGSSGAAADGSASPSGVISGAVSTCNSSALPGDMVSVPAGDFTMGCGSTDTQCVGDEKPPHTVTLGAFEIDRTEVTQDQYSACVTANACTAPTCAWDCSKTNYPATCLAWAQAKTYCAWAAKRLPTEAEWEKAARGTDGRLYPWGNDTPDCAHTNMAGCGAHAEPVGNHLVGASPYGAMDMAGNVVEMVADWYDAAYYATSPQDNPTGPAAGTRYAGRGGGYKSDPVWQRASSRDWYDITDSSEPLGFRCAR
jgi:formylglycine-generating enzyme required for sulfatase activity